MAASVIHLSSPPLLSGSKCNDSRSRRFAHQFSNLLQSFLKLERLEAIQPNLDDFPCSSRASKRAFQLAHMTHANRDTDTNSISFFHQTRCEAMLVPTRQVRNCIASTQQ